MRDRRCETCRWWDPEGSERTATGECHRRSPQEQDAQHIGYWPRTRDRDWCGEWEQNTEIPSAWETVVKNIMDLPDKERLSKKTLLEWAEKHRD